MKGKMIIQIIIISTILMQNISSETKENEFFALHKQKIEEYKDLIPSNIVIQGFLEEIMVLDNLDIKWGMEHRLRVKYVRKIMNRAKIETNYGTAKGAITCNKYNNHFGLVYNKRRLTYSYGKAHWNYAKYNTWCESYLDYLIKLLHENNRLKKILKE